MTKSETIKSTLLATRNRRADKDIYVYKVKVDRSKLSKKTREELARMFIEAKWVYNHILAHEDIFTVNTTHIKTTRNLDKDRNEVIHEINILGSQIKQSLLDRMKSNIKGLAITKTKGRKIGGLKFKSEISTLDLKQYGTTYSIRGNNRIKIQGIKSPLRVRGLKQIPSQAEYANATIEKAGEDYFISITCYLPREVSPRRKKQALSAKNKTLDVVGVDFGVANDLTLNNGVVIEVKQEIGKRIKKEHKSLSRKTKRSNNWYKQKAKLAKAYGKQTNQKNEIKHKIKNHFETSYAFVGVQNENIKGWHSGLFGKQIQQSSIGGIISDIKKNPNTLIVDRFFPSTQQCSSCSSRNLTELKDRVYNCKSCGHSESRDQNSARNLIQEALRIYAENSLVPTERRDFKLVETMTPALEALAKSCKLLSLRREAHDLSRG
jgi:putative transposase